MRRAASYLPKVRLFIKVMSNLDMLYENAKVSKVLQKKEKEKIIITETFSLKVICALLAVMKVSRT